MNQTKPRILLLGLMLLIGMLLGIIVTFGFLSVAYGQTYSEKDSIGFLIPLMLDNTLADWDSARVILYRDTTVIDTTDLTSSTSGIYLAKHNPLSPGGYCALYLAFYGSDTAADAWHFAVLDTSELQGAASGLSVADVQSACSTAADENPSLFKDGACAGTGINVVNIYAKNIADSIGIQNAQIDIWNLARTNHTAGSVSTANSGLAIFSLDDDSFSVTLKKDFWSFGIETLVVSGVTSATYYGTGFIPASPPADSMCNVYGYIINKNGTKCESCLVVIDIDEKYLPVKYHGQFVSWFPDTAYTDSTGLWQMSLYWTSVLSPDTTKYDIRQINPYDNKIWLEEDVSVPDSISWFYGQ